ncbi:MAG TPA: hypothetical protein VFB49_13405 [Patescibacteria group bacterium]|nr:hypothetical protein [Patescibacteria group bacterium]
MGLFLLELLAACAAAVALTAAARAARSACARSGAGVEPVEGAALGLSVAAGVLLLFQNVLVHDALWYYSYLRSLVVDLDLDLFQEFALRNPNGMYLPPPGTPIFHLGTALFAAPAEYLAWPVARWLSACGWMPGGDGYGALEVLAATWSSMMLGIGAVALTHRLARRVTPGGPSALAQVVLLYASPMAFFTFVWPGYPHAASAFLAAIFVLLWDRVGRRARPGSFFLLGLLGGALALVHPQDALYLALPAADLAWRAWRSRRSPARWRVAGLRALRSGAALLPGAALLGGAALGFAPQMAAWLLTRGTVLEPVYGEIGDPFLFDRPAFLAVLFSGFNGLLTWTPICGVAVAGLVMLARRRSRLGAGLLAVLGLEWWAIASYGYWWGGASFGARYFLSAYPAFGVGLAVVAAALVRRAGPYLAAAAGAPFVLWNLLLMAQFRLEWIPHNRPPDFVSVLGRQLSAAPAALLAGLTGPFRWNRVLAIDTLRAAIEDGRASMVLLWGALWTAALLAAIAWTLRLSREVPSDRLAFAARRGWLLCGGGAAIAATILVALAATDAGERRIRLSAAMTPLEVRPGVPSALALLPPEEGPTIDQPTAVVVRQPAHGTRPGNPPLTLSVVSFLTHGEARRSGEPVAWLTVGGAGCREARYPLRAGIETAETAPGRREAAALMRHEIERADPIQSWWQDDDSSRHYWGFAYLATIELPPLCAPENLRVEMTPGPGSMVLRAALVSSDQDGGEAGP